MPRPRPGVAGERGGNPSLPAPWGACARSGRDGAASARRSTPQPARSRGEPRRRLPSFLAIRRRMGGGGFPSAGVPVRTGRGPPVSVVPGGFALRAARFADRRCATRGLRRRAGRGGPSARRGREHPSVLHAREPLLDSRSHRPCPGARHRDVVRRHAPSAHPLRPRVRGSQPLSRRPGERVGAAPVRRTSGCSVRARTIGVRGRLWARPGAVRHGRHAHLCFEDRRLGTRRQRGRPPALRRGGLAAKGVAHAHGAWRGDELRRAAGCLVERHDPSGQGVRFLAPRRTGEP